jgi:FG-GAP-like repeat
MSRAPHRTAPKPKRKWLLPSAALLVAGLSCWGISKWRAASAGAKAEADDESVIAALVMAEETYLALSPEMARLSADWMELSLPGEKSRDLFSTGSVPVTDAGPAPALPTDAPSLVFREWPVAAAPVSAKGADLKLWNSITAGVAWFSHAKIYLIRGEHPGGAPDRFHAKAGFEALGSMKAGGWTSFSGHMDLEWAHDGKAWHITAWHTRDIQFASSKERLFTEVFDLSVPTATAAALRNEAHYAETVKYYQAGQKNPPHPYFSTISANHKPGVAVADVNADGLDDLYIMVRIGNNVLLVNKGDGTFADESVKYGLSLPGHTTCAIFADFDNDGDTDALLGRSLLKTAYLENRAGLFVQHKAPPWSPMAVVSMSAADYNKDGLLDVYLCTYRAAAPPQSAPGGGVAAVGTDDFDWMDEFLPPDQAQEYRRRLKAERALAPDGAFPNLLDQVGPPNMLLVNKGGGVFEPAPENKTVGLWRNSLQATWADYDRDGDPDLYVANDWGPDNLLRNDGAAGFTDISKEAGITSYGFAMGASWGDYDNDGRDDIYVSNMYSKAGRRITASVPGIAHDFIESAQGNYLYHQAADGKFTQVAGMKKPAMTVMKAGWSWGGKFADFDNDGWEDLYVLSGYFTAPKELSSELDL